MSDAESNLLTDDMQRTLLISVESETFHDDAEMNFSVDRPPMSEEPPSYLRGVSEPNRFKVEAHTHAFREHVQKTTESILAAGEEACAIKGILRRKGQFSGWVQSETSCSMDTVERYMNAFRRFGSKKDIAIRLGITDLCDLAAPRVPKDLSDFVLKELARGRRFGKGEISRLIDGESKEIRSPEQVRPHAASADNTKTIVSLQDAEDESPASAKHAVSSSNIQEAMMVRIIVECFKADPEEFLTIYDAVECRGVLPKVAEELRLIVQEPS